MLRELTFRIGSAGAGYTDIAIRNAAGRLQVAAESALRAPAFRFARSLAPAQSAAWLAAFAALGAERWQPVYRDLLAPDDEKWQLCCSGSRGSFRRCGIGAGPEALAALLTPRGQHEAQAGSSHPANWQEFLSLVEQALPPEAQGCWIPPQGGAGEEVCA